MKFLGKKIEDTKAQDMYWSVHICNRERHTKMKAVVLLTHDGDLSHSAGRILEDDLRGASICSG